MQLDTSMKDIHVEGLKTTTFGSFPCQVMLQGPSQEPLQLPLSPFPPIAMPTKILYPSRLAQNPNTENGLSK